MQQLPVLYYDGQSARGRHAFLTLNPDRWEIVYQDSDAAPETVRWRLGQINEVEEVNGIFIVRYGAFPQQVVEVHDNKFLTLLKQVYPDEKFAKTSFMGMIKGWKLLAGLSVILLTLLISFYFFLLPLAAEFIAAKVPQEYEVELGNSMLQGFVSDEEKDKKLTKLANDFALNIQFQTSYPIKITVVKSADLNAYALPGGHVVVYDEIIRKMKSPEEFAALLSHEVSHIHYQHSLKSLSRTLAGYLFISILFNDINGITTALVDNANTLRNLSYSRSLEEEADRKALITLEKNNLDQKGMVRLFETLNAQKTPELVKFISTHPLTEERIEMARASAAKQKQVARNQALYRIWSKIEETTK